MKRYRLCYIDPEGFYDEIICSTIEKAKEIKNILEHDGCACTITDIDTTLTEVDNE